MTDWVPWTDAKGRFVPFKLAIFLALFAPVLWVAWQWAQGDLDPKPVTEALHQTGAWSVRILLVSLAITPLRGIAHWPRLIDVRRMVGVGALAYVLVHFGLYIYDQGGNLWRVVSEIALRFYLTIGFVALVGLTVLGVTSTDGWVRRLGGPRWSRLHRNIYWLMIFCLVHAFLQSKVDVSEPVMMTGFFLFLMGWRRLNAKHWRSPPFIAALAIACAALTALVEAAWYKGKTGVDATRVLAANLDIDLGLRPALIVLIAGLALAALRYLGEKRAPARKPRPA